MHPLPKSGEPTHMVIYVVEENGQKTVAYILVNHLVKDRHS